MSEYEVQDVLGRLVVDSLENHLTESMVKRLYEIAAKASDLPLKIDHAMYVEYNRLYGVPNLPPHFDRDTNDLIVNMQLESNTDWEIGLNLQTYTLKDNSAVLFNGNTESHWRTKKTFKDGEYVKMVFVRFYNSEKRSDYSYLPNNPGDEVFKEINELIHRLSD